jgi:hypothetical protein
MGFAGARQRLWASNPQGIQKSQRDSGSKPGVARNELPRERSPQNYNPSWGCGGLLDETELPQPRCGWKFHRTITQGSSFLATAGLTDTIPLGLKPGGGTLAPLKLVALWPLHRVSRYHSMERATSATRKTGTASLMGMVLITSRFELFGL